ncbi:MAG: Uma2 family endonuclease [Planctomycetota bacterium]
MATGFRSDVEPASQTPQPGDRIPALCAGDRLTRVEFERRYEAMPDCKKAELLDGVVYMPSPVSFENHGEPHADLTGWLVAYRAVTPGVQVADNSTVRLDLDNEPQPDTLVRVLPECGGVTTNYGKYIAGGPELVCEVAASSVSYDLHQKKSVYRRHGVQEYLVWRVEESGIDWFVLNEGNYEPLPVGEDGVLRSRIFPGLWLDPAALLAGDLAKVLAVGAAGVATGEHADFVKRLQSARQ